MQIYVNVIEISDERVIGNSLFTNYESVDKHFTACLQENTDLSLEEIEETVKQGYYQSLDGTYIVTTSEPIFEG